WVSVRRHGLAAANHVGWRHQCCCSNFSGLPVSSIHPPRFSAPEVLARMLFCIGAVASRTLPDPLGFVAYFDINLMQHLTYLLSEFWFQPPIHTSNALGSALGTVKAKRMHLGTSPTWSGPR